jgi:hypothetical protein
MFFLLKVEKDKRLQGGEGAATSKENDGGRVNSGVFSFPPSISSPPP